MFLNFYPQALFAQQIFSTEDSSLNIYHTQKLNLSLKKYENFVSVKSGATNQQ
jgi:hypothetical protein